MMTKNIMEEFAGIDMESAHPALISHILDAINSAILVIDHQDSLLLFNSRAEIMFGAGMLERGKRVLKKIFMHDDKDILLPNILKISRQQGEFEGEVMLRRWDSSTFIALIATSAWPWKNGKAVVITIHDITRLKGIEKLLNNSERMAFLGSMLDDISHQIRNPVLAIGGFSRRLARTSQECPEYLEAITDEATRLERLLDSLTEFIHLPPQKPVHISIDQIIAALQPLLSRIADRPDINIDLNNNPGRHLLEPAFIDMEALSRAVDAVLINCADESCNGKPVSVNLTLMESGQPGMALTLIIQDTGQGIRPQLLSRIFDPFFTTKTGHPGMGLTLARRIIQEAHGIIGVDSDFGHGTEVKLHLPMDRRRKIRREKL